jgi:hypothetical protein
MKLPYLTELQNSRDMIDVFKGYNHNLRIGEGEFYDMKNLTSTYYPVLSPRVKRGLYDLTVEPQGLFQKDSLCYVDNGYFVINNNRVDMELENTPKQLTSMGAYVIIMPDKKWIKTIPDKDEGTGAENFDFGDIEAEVKVSNATFQMCKVDGTNYPANIPTEEPKDPENADLWIDTSSKPHTLKQYSSASEMWVSIATTYIKIEADEIGLPFAVGDGVTISGIKNEKLLDLNNTMIIWDKGDDYIVVIGILDEVIQESNTITIKRQMPEMDFIIESGNRLWGCKYGVAKNGEVVNEIYASKLGDFKNWNCFMGISTDSYAATVGTSGEFTGAITHLGYPIFFKEDYMHKVYGNYPSNYQITTTACRGVQKGSNKSLAIVNETLFYKSRNAVCVYDGSLPQEISYQLGNVPYSNAVACSHGDKYYISMRDNSDGKWKLFVYDTLKGVWHKEDDTQVIDFCSCDGELYYIDAGDKRIKTVFGSGIEKQGESKVKWMAETGLIGADYIGNKYISKLNIRMALELNSRVECYIQYDSNEVWDFVFRMDGVSLRSFTVPIRPKRCDHFRLRIEGEGEAKIYSISKTIEEGSDK